VHSFVEDLAQIVDALRGIFSDEPQIRGDEESPPLGGNVARVWFSGRHVPMLPPLNGKFITSPGVCCRKSIYASGLLKDNNVL
jgi:hypothetical protein